MSSSLFKWRSKASSALCLLPFFVLMLFVGELSGAATITIINLDGAGEGFNDPTPAAPVGGNTGTTVGQQRLNVFQRVAEIWGSKISSPVPILVGASFDALSCTPTSATLGSAGAVAVFRDFAGAPVASTWYPSALANALAGLDLDPGGHDIRAQFNSNIGTAGCLSSLSWYYGLDGNPPGGTIELLDTVLHELAHGLGFQTFVNLSSGAKFNNFDDAFMRNLEDHSTGKTYPIMTDAERVTASQDTGDLHWTGANVVANSGFLTSGRGAGNHVEMYAPSPSEPGSSVSHFSTSLLPDELMEPFLTATSDRRLTSFLLQDIGWSITPEAALLQAAGYAIITESCGAGNGVIDPDETVTVNFSLRNVGGSSTTTLVATLQAIGEVTSPSGAQSYGALIAGGASVSRPFTFKASGVCGGTITAVLQLQDGSVNLGTVTNTFTLGSAPPATNLFSNTGAISIPNSGSATPYPSLISVSGLIGTVTKVTVTLTNITHTFPDDIDVLLVSPAGQKALLMSDAGAGINLVNVSLTFDDAAVLGLPDSSQIVSGTFKPTNYDTTSDGFGAPAPGSPYAATLSAFNESNPNGTWSLYVRDDAASDLGSIANGWQLTIVTVPPAVCCEPATVVGRKVFYNRSAWDGNDANANANDDNAMATDKSALLPGGTATFANYTSYSRGLNGIMVDIANLLGTPTVSDFTFKTGNDNDPSGWATAPSPVSLTARSLVSGVTRLTLIWNDNNLDAFADANEAVAKQWLQVTVKATVNTGLAAADVFYFGHALGECGNSLTAATVDTTDVLLPFYNQTAGGAAILTSAYDINRDRSVDTTDVLLPFYHQTGVGTALLLLDLSGSAASVPAGAPSQPEPMSLQDLAALFAGEPFGGGSGGDETPANQSGRLTVQRVGFDQLRLCVPESQGSWRLEVNDDLRSPDWRVPEATYQRTPEGPTWIIRIDSLAQARFFRAVALPSSNTNP